MNWKKLIVSLILPQAAGFVGALVNTQSSRAWYSTLVKPALTPPGYVFGIVWPILYLLIGVSFYLVWTRPNVSRLTYWVFGAQLALNTLWSLVFFGTKSPGVALIVIVLLWAAIIWNMVLFWRVSRPAALLLVPYLLWVTFATYLNFGINIFA